MAASVGKDAATNRVLLLWLRRGLDRSMYYGTKVNPKDPSRFGKVPEVEI